MRIVFDARPLAQVKHDTTVFAAAERDIVALGWFMEAQAVHRNLHFVHLTVKREFFQHDRTSSEIPALSIFLVHNPLHLSAHLLIVAERFHCCDCRRNQHAPLMR